MEHKLSARSLRVALVIILAIMIAGGVAGFLLIRTKLIDKAAETARISAEAASGQDKVKNLKQAQTELLKNEAVEKKVREMVATSAAYAYQEQIVLALKSIGDSAGVQVKTVNFTSTAQLGAEGAASAPATTPNSAVPADVKLTQAAITIETPLRYDNLMRFLRYLEQNTMTTNVSKISMSKANDEKSQGQLMVNCDVLTIGVYMR